MPSNDLENLLQKNKEWVKEVLKVDPHFFEQSAKKQSPKALWIGCSDSRVPESLVTGSKPGDIFVHRNIANQVHLKDDNLLSVVEYAVDPHHLGVKHVIIVGHTECGGAKHCLQESQNPHPSPPTTPLLHWLKPLTDLARTLHLDSHPPAEALLELVKANVIQQVQHVAQIETVKSVRAKGGELWIHGWIYDLSTGLLSVLETTKENPGN